MFIEVSSFLGVLITTVCAGILLVEVVAPSLYPRREEEVERREE